MSAPAAALAGGEPATLTRYAHVALCIGAMALPSRRQHLNVANDHNARHGGGVHGLHVVHKLLLLLHKHNGLLLLRGHCGFGQGRGDDRH